MTSLTDPTGTSSALYCRATGRRLAPESGSAPVAGMAVAVLVFDDGQSTSISGDSVVGRAPSSDRRVQDGMANAITVVDPTMAVSRCHLLLRVRHWALEVIDLGSRNGTFVVERSGRSRAITPGLGYEVSGDKQIRIGHRLLSVHQLRT